MMVYRERVERRSTADPAGADLLIETGELEAGVADELCPEIDADLPVLRRLRRASVLAARGVRDVTAGLPLPETVAVSPPEGYAYYALYPETYRRAARRYYAEARPERVAVTGIRSIGTSLSAVVAWALEEKGCEVRSWTVRPRGHPFDRRLALAPELENCWRGLAGSWHFAIVDEGPGLSGSSFGAVARKLEELGVPEERVAFFPSWDPDPARLLNADARRRWQRHKRYATPFEDLGMFAADTDLSGGAWRGAFYGPGCARPAAAPQHERRKYLREGRWLFKFAGLGRYGRRALERAERLAKAGFAPPVAGFENGFLVTRWVAGRPVEAGVPAPQLSETMAAYLAHLYREFRVESGTPGAALEEMIRVNAAEGLGAELRLRAREGPPVALDGRMFPHEWIATGRGFVKTDAVDHHDDHFFPGPQDIAWDLAAAQIEFGMGREAAAHFAARYAALSGDRDIAARLPFYRMAWLAFRLGYCAMAADALAGSHDGAAFRMLRRRYAGRLRREAARG